MLDCGQTPAAADGNTPSAQSPRSATNGNSR
jgi:hypothetical protein